MRVGCTARFLAGSGSGGGVIVSSSMHGVYIHAGAWILAAIKGCVGVIVMTVHVLIVYHMLCTQPRCCEVDHWLGLSRWNTLAPRGIAPGIARSHFREGDVIATQGSLTHVVESIVFCAMNYMLRQATLLNYFDILLIANK